MTATIWIYPSTEKTKINAPAGCICLTYDPNDETALVTSLDSLYALVFNLNEFATIEVLTFGLTMSLSIFKDMFVDDSRVHISPYRL